jgi:hypothetical protein
MERKGTMRHLMWILTWIAVGIGGVLGAATVIVVSQSRQPSSQGPDIIAGGNNASPVLVNKPTPGGPTK